MLVDDLYHLLIPITLRHANEAAELADTMINMHYEIADLELLYFLECERHFTTTRLVTLEIILMEAVKYLMIRKDANTQIVVGKTFVESLFDGGKDSLTPLKIGKLLCLENFAESFVLFLTVCENKDLITLQQIVLEGFCQKIEVLMEKRLDGNMKVYCR